MMAAAVTSLPEMQLDPKEAEALAEAASEVAKYYPQLAMMSGKSVAITSMASALGMVYLPRMVAVRMRVQALRAKGRVPPAPPLNPLFDQPATGGDVG